MLIYSLFHSNSNLYLGKEYRDIFADGFDVDTILQNITLINPTLVMKPHEAAAVFAVIFHAACFLYLLYLSTSYNKEIIRNDEIESNNIFYAAEG